MELKKGIEKAVEAVVGKLKKLSKPIKDNKEITQVATISANGDAQIGEIIAKAMDRVGKDGVITVEEAKGFETTLEVVEGMNFDRGYLSAYFVTNPETLEAEYEDALVLIYEKKIASMNYVAESIFRWSIPDVINKDAEQILPEELRALIDSPQVEEEVIEKELDCPVGDGQVIPLEVGATRLKDENENFLGYVLLFKDLSEVRTLRKEIARTQRLATVGRLAAG